MKNLQDSGRPIFSCVIPTNGRVNLLLKLLKSLTEANKINGVALEIIIIDDSTPPSDKEILEACKQYNAIYLKGSSSVREKRNLGITNAIGEYVFFIDSDCEASIDLFEQHYKILTQSDISACIGVTKFVGKNSLVWDIISNTKFLDSFNFPNILKGCVSSAPWGPTTNLSVKKTVLDKIGGFEIKLPFKLGADDADLGLRINDHGFHIGMNENAIVFHSRETWSSFNKIIRRVYRWGRMDYYLFYQRHINKTFITLPKTISFFYVVLIFSILSAVFFLPILLILIPLFWLILFLFSLAHIKKIHWKISNSIGVLIGSEFLNFLFDLGCSFESLKHGSLKFLYRESIDDPRNLWHKKIHEMWAALLSFFVTILLSIIWLAYL